MRRTGRHPKWMRFSLEFHHAGGNCWVLERSGYNRYRFSGDAEHLEYRFYTGEDAFRALVYGLFRRYVEVLDNREYVVFGYTTTPLWRLFDGVRLVEHRDGRATELMRYVRA